MQRSILICICVIAIAALGACGSGGDDVQADNGGVRPAADVHTAATGRQGRLPKGCKVNQIVSLLKDFTRAANRRDRGSLFDLIAPRPELRGIQLAIGRPPDIKSIRLGTRRRIVRYFLRNARFGTRMRLRSVRVRRIRGAPQSGPFRRPKRGPAADDSVASFAWVVRLRGGELPMRKLDGKGGINCVTQQIYIMAAQIII